MRQRWRRSATRWWSPGGAGSSQLELHARFDDDVDGDTLPLCRCETPLSYRGNRPLVQAKTQAVQQPHITNGSVATHDNLHQHLAYETAPSGFFRVITFYLANQARWCDATAGTICATAETAADTGTDAGSITFADAGTNARSCTTAAAGAGALLTRFDFFEHAGALSSVVRRTHDRRNDRGRDWLRRNQLSGGNSRLGGDRTRQR